MNVKASEKTTYSRTAKQGLYRHRNGTYYARSYVARKSVWRSLKTKNRECAIRDLPKILAEITLLKPTPVIGQAKPKTVGELIELYLQKIHWTKKPLTASYYEQLIKKARKIWPRMDPRRSPSLDQLKPLAVKESDAEKFIYFLKHAPTCPTRVNNTIGAMRAIFTIGIEEGVLLKNPFAKIHKVKVSARPFDLPTNAQFKQILELIRNEGAWCSRGCADLVEFLTYSGLRIGEATKIRWSDYKPEAKKLGFWALKKRDEQPVYRSIDLNPNMCALLEDMRANPRYFRDKKREAEGFILPVRECQKALTKACQALGVKRMIHHDLRHYFATRSLECKVDVKCLSEWLGHSDGGGLVLKTYSHLRDEHSVEMAAKMRF